MHWTWTGSGIAAFAGIALVACGGPKVSVEDTDGGTTMDTSDPSTQGPTNPSTSTPTDTTPSTTEPSGSDSGGVDSTGFDPTGPMPTQRQADILFVIDNSGSMGEEQSSLGAGMASLINVLDAGGVDYRIGVTTTDNGNPWCNTSPEGGKMVASSCRSRLPEFIFQGQTTVDAQYACTDVCPEEWASIALQPTTTDEDPTPQVRPWIEAGPSGTNLPDGLDALTALRCFVPQGINGCGFEQQLESTYKSVTRMETEAENELGFHRQGALLSIIMVTDEADCSYNFDHESIFLPDGAKTFWSDSGDQTPTSAVCWNAGVQCVGGPGTYDDCNAASYDPLGGVTDPDEAVMRPVQRYIDRLQDAYAYAIVGVPPGYPGTPITYADAPGGTPNDPGYQHNFGIGPGCTSQTAEAVPPVRVREVLEGLPPEQDMFSICATGFDDALSSIASSIVDALP